MKTFFLTVAFAWHVSARSAWGEGGGHAPLPFEEDCELQETAEFLAPREAGVVRTCGWKKKAAVAVASVIGVLGAGSVSSASKGFTVMRPSGLTGLFDESPEAIAADLARAEEKGLLEKVLEADTKTLPVVAKVGGEDKKVYLFLNCGAGATDCGSDIKALDNGFEISGGVDAFRQMLILPEAPDFKADTHELDYTSLRPFQLGEGSAVSVHMDNSQAGNCVIMVGTVDGSAESECNPVSHSPEMENKCQGTGFVFVGSHSEIAGHSDTSAPVDEKSHAEAVHVYSDKEETGDVVKAVKILSIKGGKHFTEATEDGAVVQNQNTEILEKAGGDADMALFVDMFANQGALGQAAPATASGTEGCTASQKVTFTNLEITMTPPATETE